jgi:hypothetical protein
MPATSVETLNKWHLHVLGNGSDDMGRSGGERMIYRAALNNHFTDSLSAVEYARVELDAALRVLRTLPSIDAEAFNKVTGDIHVRHPPAADAPTAARRANILLAHWRLLYAARAVNVLPYFKTGGVPGMDYAEIADYPVFPWRTGSPWTSYAALARQALDEEKFGLANYGICRAYRTLNYSPRFLRARHWFKIMRTRNGGSNGLVQQDPEFFDEINRTRGYLELCELVSSRNKIDWPEITYV